MKNNKIVSIALLIILCLGFTACNSVETYKPIDPDAYVILHVPSEGSKSEIELGYESIDEYGFYTRSEDKVFDELKGKTIKNPFNADSVLEYKSSDCALKTADGNEYGSFYSIYDVYESKTEEIEYLHGTDKLCGYFNRETTVSKGEKEENKKLDKSDYRRISDEFLLKFLSQEELNSFDKVSMSDPSQLFDCTVTYKKTICGYETDEVLQVFFDNTGVIRIYNGRKLGKYDSLENQIDQERLDHAKEYLLNKIEKKGLKDLEIRGPVLTTNGEGELYLRVVFEYVNSENMPRGDVMYVNVQ